MDKPLLELRLRLYKQHKAEVDTTLKRIEVWEEMLSKGELEYFEYVPNSILGMPRSNDVNSPIETMASRREVTREMVDQWIVDEQSRIFYKKLEIEQINTSFDALTDRQRLVIESKYLNGMTWRNIEIVFNKKYSSDGYYLGESGLRKINSEGLDILWHILKHLYTKYVFFKQYNLEVKRVAQKREEERKRKMNKKVSEK